MSDTKYLTFPESAAPSHISKYLIYFFDDGRNKNTFSDAYLKYSKFADEKHSLPKDYSTLLEVLT